MKKQQIKTVETLSMYEVEDLLNEIIIKRYGENHFVQIDVFSYEDEDFTVRTGFTAKVLLKSICS